MTRAWLLSTIDGDCRTQVLPGFTLTTAVDGREDLAVRLGAYPSL
jgi:hypothetical protein